MPTTEQREKDTNYRRNRRAADPAYAARRRAASLEWKRRHVRRINQIVADAKRDQPCVDCGVAYPAPCMDFDHVRGEKLFGIAKAARRNRTIQEVKDEIAKCDIRCANCHRLRHFSSAGED